MQKYHHGRRAGRGAERLGIAFAYHSGKIENDDVTYRDTREIFERDGVTAYTGNLRTLFEIRNAKEAHEMFLYFDQNGHHHSKWVGTQKTRQSTAIS